MERQQQCDSDVHSIFWAQHWYITAKDENADEFRSIQDVAIPQPIPRYNAYMGGVDKSDQFISYNRVLRKTKWYWKTMFYHHPVLAEDFRDRLLLRIISSTAMDYLKTWQENFQTWLRVVPGHPRHHRHHPKPSYAAFLTDFNYYCTQTILTNKTLEMITNQQCT